MEKIKESIIMILDALDESAKGNREVNPFSLFRNKLKDIEGFILFLQENAILSDNDINMVSNSLYEALLYNDQFLLEDTLRYALLSVYDQIFEEGNENE